MKYSNVERIHYLLTDFTSYKVATANESASKNSDFILAYNQLLPILLKYLYLIHRVLQLTSYVEDGGERDNIAVLKALQAQIHGKMGAAHEFLNVISFIIYLLAYKIDVVKEYLNYIVIKPYRKIM